MKNKQVILLLSNNSTDTIIDTFKEITVSTQNFADSFFVYHQKEKYTPENIRALNHYIFTDDIFEKLPYIPLKERSIIPGCDHFPLLQFYLDNPGYEYYWSLEDDVKFSGSWNNLFETYSYNESDLISAYINTYNNEPNWPWWNSLGNTNGKVIQLNQRMKSFNPIRRISNRGMLCLHNHMSNGWYGHLEVLMPTLFKHEGFKIIDFGGKGPFVPVGFEHKFYDASSYSHMPITLGDKLNYIYHPIKAIKRPNITDLKNTCVISAVGKGSLHKKWIDRNADFDLHLLIYDDSYSYYFNDSPFIYCQKGYKLKLIYDYLQTNPDYIEKYDYFFFPDDDIDINSENIIKLFSTMRNYNLQIAQPALTDSYYTYEHTMKQKGVMLRYTNFVEMMAPCFSRNALEKVLFTFNENVSGWGTEYHWSELIGFTGEEMAVIDSIHCVHTRPIQSYNTQNSTELIEYIQKYHLNQEIKEYNYIPLNKAESCSLIQDREICLQLEQQVQEIAQILLKLINANELSCGINEGISGIILFLIQFYQLSGKRKYLDIALNLTEQLSEKVSHFKHDLSYSTGLTGFTWLIEFLVQHEYIEDDTDEILEELCNYLNDSGFESSTDLSFANGISGFGFHFIARLRNKNYDFKKPINQKELEVLNHLIQNIDHRYCQLTNNKKKYHIISDCLLFLCKVNEVLPTNEHLKMLINKLITILKKCKPSKNYTETKKAYVLYTAAKTIGDAKLKSYSLKIIYNLNCDFTEIASNGIQDFYLLNKLYIATQDNVIKQKARIWLEILLQNKSSVITVENLLRNKDNTYNGGIYTGLCGWGLTLISCISNVHRDWDECMLF